MYIQNWRGHINLRINRDSTRLVPPQKKSTWFIPNLDMSFFSTCKLGRSSFVGFCWPCSFVHSMWTEETLPQSLPATALTPGTDVPPGSAVSGMPELKWGARWSYQAIEWGSQTHEYLMNISIVCEKNISFDWRTHPNLSHILQKMPEMTVHSGKKRAIARISSWLSLCVAGGTAISSSSLVYVALRRNWSCPATISGWPGDNSHHRPLIPPGCWRSTPMSDGLWIGLIMLIPSP